jgi:hypothetical protein
MFATSSAASDDVALWWCGLAEGLTVRMTPTIARVMMPSCQSIVITLYFPRIL